MSAAHHPAATRTQTSRRNWSSLKPFRHHCWWLTVTVLQTVPAQGDTLVTFVAWRACLSNWGIYGEVHIEQTEKKQKCLNRYLVLIRQQMWSQWLYQVELLSRKLHDLFMCLWCSLWKSKCTSIITYKGFVTYSHKSMFKSCVYYYKVCGCCWSTVWRNLFYDVSKYLNGFWNVICQDKPWEHLN